MKNFAQRVLLATTFGIALFWVDVNQAKAAERLTKADMMSSTGSRPFVKNHDKDKDGECCDGIGDAPAACIPVTTLTGGTCKITETLSYPICTKNNVTGTKLCLGADWKSCITQSFTHIENKTCEQSRDAEEAEISETFIYSSGCYNSPFDGGC